MKRGGNPDHQVTAGLHSLAAQGKELVDKNVSQLTRWVVGWEQMADRRAGATGP